MKARPIMATNETIEYLKRCLEHAPRKPISPIAKNLAGFLVAEGVFVCSECSGRIMDRGCALPNPAEPVWKDQPHGACSCCEKTPQE